MIEGQTIADGGRGVARAAARVMATRARSSIGDAHDVLERAGDEEAAAVASAAIESLTALIRATYDGEEIVFACGR
jgi:hypothetical protein